MGGLLAVLYGIICYAIFLVTILYAIGFVGNLAVPKSIDSTMDAGGPPLQSVIVNLALLTIFALQHSIMARPAFKRFWTRVVPKSVERSTYVLFASALLLLLFWQWRPILDPVWIVEEPLGVTVIQAIFWLGWVLLFLSTFLINHFELFGLRQVFARLLGKALPAPVFRTPFLYRSVRHPLYLGFLLAFWATPAMTVGHLLFSVATTGYILIGIALEERDLIDLFGDQYRHYRAQVGMLIPLPWRKYNPDADADPMFKERHP
jgi:methanethiol S-methyltransferase